MQNTSLSRTTFFKQIYFNFIYIRKISLFKLNNILYNKTFKEFFFLIKLQCIFKIILFKFYLEKEL